MNFIRKKIKVLIIIFVVTLFVTVIINWSISSAEVKLDNSFEEGSISINDYDLNDLGIVDANNDGFLDIFTTNHSARQSLLLGSSSGKFNNVLTAWSLDQDTNFPGLENSANPPKLSTSGLYIYRQNSLLHIRAVQISQESLSGEIQFSSDAVIRNQQAVDYQIKESFLPSGATQSIIEFTLHNGGWLTIENFVEIPHQVNLDSDVDLTNVYVGSNKINPHSHNFTLNWRDRHSMAWADINSDGSLDLFMNRGAVKGKMSELPEAFNDELLVTEENIHKSNTAVEVDNNRFTNRASSLGIEKNDCPGRQSAWVDFDKDGRMDLYNVCGRGKTDSPHPNQLYQQQSDGSFINIGKQLHLDLPRNGLFKWFDVDNDGDLDLFASQDNALNLYLNQEQKFVLKPIDITLKGKARNIAVADYNGDRYPDIYITTKEENVFLANQKGNLMPKDPLTIGLPSNGVAANWVDYDNDGLLDLYVFPNGLYQQNIDGKFQETQILAELTKDSSSASPITKFWKGTTVNEAISNWFDFDNDGDRDLLIAVRREPALQKRVLNRFFPSKASKSMKSRSTSSTVWETKLYRNIGKNNHWLEIELEGAKGNKQGIGATVIVVTPDGRKQSQLVGNSEGSRYSQGHYRLYFGLGKNSQPDYIQVIWSDGQSQIINNPKGNRLLKVKKTGNSDNLSPSI